MLLGLLWLLSWVSAAQLEAEARAQSALYADDGSPFHWNFRDPEVLVGPVLGGQLRPRGRYSADALSLTLTHGDANLGLRFSGRRVDPHTLPRLRLSLGSAQPLQWRLAATSDLRPDLPVGPWMPWPPASGAGTAEGFDPASNTFETDLGPLLPPLDAPIAQLRLHLKGVPGQTVELRALSLHPRCVEERCLPPRRELPHRLLPSQLLADRDAALLDSPQSRVGADAPEWLVGGVLAMRALTLPQAVVLALLVLGCALSARWLAPPGRRRLALAMGAGLPILLLSLGLPRFPPQPADGVLILGWVLALWWLRPLGPRTQWERTPTSTPGSTLLGTRRAWRSALVVTAAGLVLLGLLSLAGDGPEAAGLDVERARRYLGWAALQQAWLALFLLPHLREPGKDVQTAAVAGLLFAALHLPNAELMALCLFGGWAWVRIALKHGSLLPQILSHASLGLAASALLPQAVLRSLEVGGRYVFAPL
ncbi:CPBP family intramembrane glutamic endopeptidase [Aquimonas voraii]|uniref:CAAX protease self-immunity n=1 Tax=Aquimonas voraii TaxID=265719 RepID=A0A1G6XU27_9GAMM|nr:CPBP family intramembrane glutamic endopeptidase [Aquimonas voraii]SDD80897.1 CAAX protease self-immunity [Aquimonas voraii]